MSFRTLSPRPWLGAVALAAALAGPAAAQPPGPLELARGLRENGQLELAVEYLKEVEGKPLSGDDKAALLLERSKCLLEASEEEPDEGTRQGMIAQAKEGLNAFVQNHPKHPRAVEGLLSVARLTSLDAKEVLSRARKMEVPPAGDDAAEGRNREQALQKQAAEAARARPLFQLASKRFAEASARLKAQIEDKALDAGPRRVLEREAFEAELASGINQFNIAETYMPDEALTGPQKTERAKFLGVAKETFNRLSKGAQTSRTVWVARAWHAEVMYEQSDAGAAAAEVNAVLRSNLAEAEDGKRLARFFQLRRNARAALAERAAAKINSSVGEMREWLRQYGAGRRPTPEVFAVNYFLARTLHFQADAITPPPKPPATAVVPSETARRLYEEAERIYRKLAQSDHEYTARASRYRVSAVRRLLGEADQNPLAYATFEKAQMASLIQLGKLTAAEDKEQQALADPKAAPAARDAARAEVKRVRDRVIALLERARELAAPQDAPADVTDVQLRLIYYYLQNDQFYQAAVLGDHVAHTVKSTGGKPAIAGLLAIGGYVSASRAARGDSPEAIGAARRTDRDRAVALARFLDERYPNDAATDAARHRLAGLLADENKLMEAYEVLAKVRPGYAQLTGVRLLQGYVVSQLVAPLDSKLSKDEKANLFRRATGELAKVPKPALIAAEDEVRGYLSARCRLASMMLAQNRADPETEARDAGFNRALFLCEEILAEVPTFESLADPDKKLNLDGLELNYLALDTYTRALYLRARAMTNNGQFDGSMALIKPTLDQVATKGPLMTAEVRGWAGLGGGASPEERQKARVAQLAAAIDKGRVDVILAGFRTQVRQGKAPEAAKMLDLLARAGGSIEESLPLLEPVARELAALMVARQKEGKADEAKALGAGLGVLLDKIRSVKTLTVPMTLFIGQTLQSIGKSADAIETLKAVPAPTYKDWDKKKADEIPQEERGKVTNQIRDYAIAQHTVIQARIDLKQFADAEKALNEILGTNEKPGWGAGRLYFRKALAELYEAKGAAEPDLKKASAEWGLAVKQWTTLFQIQNARLGSLQQQKGSDPQALVDARNAFADAFFDLQRCVVVANQQLRSGPAQAANLQKTYADVARKCADIEKRIAVAEWQPEVRNRYHELIKATPPLEEAYKAAGGTMFLEKAQPRP
ncbi:hypothetical protein R5W23_002448 [Gemmata sp. JC673]|uniref:Tetratricopeptide repeat protein n=1 Tax=Gemmata algarum TaxID=2975278 RepID=A0ABU5F0S8_9BACT|nr:hypothetical protein [Gemmata algarum]MDY3561186.1 hypothetical protein [Gemmata algarum]